MAKGIIYIMTTSVTGLIKIGKTRTDQFESRMQILEQNGYWNVNGLHRYFASEVDDYDEKEKLIHTIFSKSQVASSELFALDKDLAKAMLESFEGDQVYPPVIKKRRKTDRKSSAPLRFSMLGIPAGTVLEYLPDRSKTVVTVDERNRVSLDGQVYALSKAAEILYGKGPLQGGLFFGIRGKSLVNMRKEKEKSGPKSSLDI